MTWFQSLPLFVAPLGGIFIGVSLYLITERDERIADRERARAKTPAE